MTVLSIDFKDFKKLANNNRVYYYEGFDFYDFSYLVDGNIVKSTVLKSSVTDKQRFFSDELFNGAVALAFRIPEDRDDPVISKVLPKGFAPDIDGYQDEEVKQEDIQRDGVEEVE